MTLDGNPLVLSVLGVVVMLGIGAAIGCLNGLIITRLKMPSFIATMSTSLIFSGFALWYTESATIGGLPKPFLLIGNGRPLGIPFPILIMAVVLTISAYILHRTILGRRIFAVGTNHMASRISGIAVKKTIFTLFVFSGILASIGTIVMTSKSGAGIPSMGKFMLMDIVGAVVIGGTAVTGGQGNMLGTAIGAVLIIVLNNSLNLLGVEWYIINAIKGAMIIAVALLGILRARGH
jgi:ribose/xylose/arabinose/galactoside ABC-type transport system permease subunit